MYKRKILILIMVLLIVIFMIMLLLLLNNVNLKNETNELPNNLVNNLLSNNFQNNSNTSTNNSYNSVISPEDQSNEISHDDEVELSVTKDYFDVKIESVYFTIKNISVDFFNTINLAFNENDAKIVYGSSNYISKMGENKEKIYELLGKQYINQSGVTKQNLEKIFSKYVGCTFNVEKISEKIVENNICKFIVYGTINEKEIYNMLIITDENNLKYTIYPYEYIITNNVDNIEISSIPANKYNNLEYKDTNQEELASHHFVDIKYYFKNNIEKLYKKLDTEYRNKRFGSLQAFYQYINDHKDIIENSTLNSYKVTRKEDYTEYNCIDNYGNHYIFKETAVMQYTLMLDNYTILTEDEANYYNNLDNFNKAKYNLNKFINMVNTKDYTAIYNNLEETFKSNNFKTQLDLEQLIKNNMYSFNNVEIEESDDKNKEYYVFSVKITNKENKEESKRMTVVIQQTDGIDYKMSFSF